MDPVIESVATRLDTLAARVFVEQRLPGLALGVVRDGELAWSAALGFADRATARPITTDTLFRIASITKSFTATAVLQLRDGRRLRLDDPLVTYVPEARSIVDPFGPIEDLTIRRLLTHSSGLQRDTPPDDLWVIPYFTEDELLARLDRVVVMAPPETAWRYSNLGYNLLGIAVGRIAGEPFATYLQRDVIDAAGLASTTAFPDGDLATRAAQGYGPRRYDDNTTASDPYDSATIFADGGLWSTVEDLGRWLVVQARRGDDDKRGEDGRVLDGPTLREMQRPGTLGNDEWTYAQGLGWGATRIGETVWIGHTGSLNGFRAIVLFRPDDGIGVIALTNGSIRPNPFAREIATIVLDAHREAEPKLPAAPPEPTPEAWLELLGHYREDDYGMGLFIEAHDGKLVIADEEDPTDTDSIIGGDDPLVFTVAEGESKGEVVHFLRNADGAIAAVNIGGAPFRRLALVKR